MADMLVSTSKCPKLVDVMRSVSACTLVAIHNAALAAAKVPRTLMLCSGLKVAMGFALEVGVRSGWCKVTRRHKVLEGVCVI